MHIWPPATAVRDQEGHIFSIQRILYCLNVSHSMIVLPSLVINSPVPGVSRSERALMCFNISTAQQALTKSSLVAFYLAVYKKSSYQGMCVCVCVGAVDHLCWPLLWRSKLPSSWLPWWVLCRRPVWVLAAAQSSAAPRGLRWAAWGDPAATPWSWGGAAGRAWCHKTHARTANRHVLVTNVSSVC